MSDFLPVQFEEPLPAPEDEVALLSLPHADSDRAATAATATVVPNMTAYGMAKAALLGFVRGAALDVVGDGITVNAVQPGLIASDNARRVLGEEGLAAYGATVPVGRAGTVDDFAHACQFFASPRAGYVTGASLVMDGGSSLAPGRGGRGDILQDRLRAQTGAEQ